MKRVGILALSGLLGAGQSVPATPQPEQSTSESTAPDRVASPQADGIDYGDELDRVVAAYERADWEGLLERVDALIDRAESLGLAEWERADLHHARGFARAQLELDAYEAGPQSAAPDFESARALAGPSHLRLDATYDLGGVFLYEGEHWRAQLPEIQAQSGAPQSGSLGPAAPMAPLPGMAAPGGADEEDPLPKARAAYQSAREHLVERLRADWRDADTRANLELIQRRLAELDEIERQREEQRQEQENQEPQEGDDSQEQDGEDGEQDNESEPDEDSNPQDSESENQDGDGEKKEGDPQEESPDESSEPKPEDLEETENETESPQEGQDPNEPGEPGEPPPPPPAQGEPDEERVLTREEVQRLMDKLSQLEAEREALAAALRQGPAYPRRARLVAMKNPMIFAVAVGLMLFVGARPRAAQGAEPVVSARLSTGVARLGENVLMEVVAQNARQARIVEVPEAEGLTFSQPSAPRQRRFSSSRNGRVVAAHSDVEWVLRVRAEEVGEFQLPPVVLEVDGQRLSTKPLTLKVVEDLRGEDLGFLEVRPSSMRVVEGQPFTIELRFGWSRSKPIQYADLSLPWWDNLPGVVELEGAPLPPDTRLVRGVLVNGEEQARVEERSGDNDPERTFRLVKSLLPVRSGTIDFSKSFFEFATIREGRSFLEGRRKAESFYVPADPFSIEVIPLPSEGQPFDFSGAVGSFEAKSSVDTRDVRVGDSIKLTVQWTGSGNFEFFDAPDPSRLDAFRDFRVYGQTEEKRFDRRSVTYDLAPLHDGVEEIPPLPLTVFDPSSKSYVSIETEPTPIRVSPLSNPRALADAEEESFERDIRDIVATPLSGALPRRISRRADAWTAGALAALPFVWLGLRTVVRRRGDPNAPIERRRRNARRALSRALRSSGVDPARETLAAFTAFLAARTREPVEAWTGREAAAFVRERGVADPAPVEAVCSFIERLEDAVFGAGASVPEDEVLAAADRWLRAEKEVGL